VTTLAGNSGAVVDIARAARSISPYTSSVVQGVKCTPVTGVAEIVFEHDRIQILGALLL
jgi:hypothetical protein